MGGSTCRQTAGVDDRKTSRAFDGLERGLVHETDGSITITSFALAKQILKSRFTTQAGFNAELVKLFPQKNPSILFLEGEAHRRRRGPVARFFSPDALRKRYMPAIEALSRRLVETFERARTGRLDDMSLQLSVGIAAEIIGMTNSLRPGLGIRLGRFFEGEGCVASSWSSIARYIVATQINLLWVYLIDVRPALRARRLSPRDDLISHLLQQGWSDLDILKECVTYGTAGISTTREFIVAAAWHLLDREDVRGRFLETDKAGRLDILAEILRLEPPVSTLYRRTVAPIDLGHQGRLEQIPADTLVAVDLRGVNTDSVASGRCPFSLRPDRDGVNQVGLMSFGDGHHRCPGAAVAMEETAIFLDRLLRIEGLRLTRPTLSRNAMSTGYVLRHAVLSIDASPATKV